MIERFRDAEEQYLAALLWIMREGSGAGSS